MIYLSKLNRKLQAMKDKNIDDIFAKKVYIPSISNTYNKNQLQVWLNKRISILQNVLDGNLTELQVNAATTIIYNRLQAEDTLTADKILAGDQVKLNGNEKGYDDLISLKLYKFITSE